MIRLRTLGSLDLRATDGSEVRSVIRQPKRLAILSYLALARPRGFQRRDVLLGRFWPETEPERARHALSQQIYSLRQRLGVDTIVGRGDDEIGIAEGRLWCDVVAFEQALADDPEAALELYRGPLLDGFYVSDAPGFEQWLEEERERLRLLAHGAAMRLVERDAPSPADAVHWARRALELSPWDEPTLRRLIELLDAAGDRAGALQAYDDFARRFQEELELHPSPETVAAVEALRVAPLPTPPRIPVPRGEMRRAPDSSPARPAAREASRRARGALQVAAVSVLLLLGVLAWQLASAPDENPADVRSTVNHIAVLYLHDESADGSLGAQASVLNDAMISELARVDRLHVRSQASVRPYRNQVVPLDSIARALNVGTIIGGNLVRSDDVLLANIEIVDPDDGTVRHRKSLQAPADDIIALAEAMNRSVLDFLRVEIGREIRREEWKRGTDKPDALVKLIEAEEVRLRARAYEEEGEYDAALSLTAEADSLLFRAVSLDPQWAEPYVLAARLTAHGMLLTKVRTPRPHTEYVTRLDRALGFVEKALQLDPVHAYAWETRGDILFRQWASDSIGGAHGEQLRLAAMNALDQALRIEPDRARAQLVRAWILYSTGRHVEARDAALRAHERDVFLEDIMGTVLILFQTAFALRDDGDASYWCNEASNRRPDTWYVGYCKLTLHAWSDLSQRDPRLAWAEHANAGSASPAAVMEDAQPMLDMVLAAALARAGESDSARAVIARTELRLPRQIDVLEARAAAWVALGEHAHAIDDLETYFRRIPAARLRVKHDRRFEPIAAALDSIAPCRDATAAVRRCRRAHH